MRSESTQGANIKKEETVSGSYVKAIGATVRGARHVARRNINECGPVVLGDTDHDMLFESYVENPDSAENEGSANLAVRISSEKRNPRVLTSLTSCVKKRGEKKT